MSEIGASHHPASTTFGKLAAKTSQFAGRGSAFLAATALVGMWAITGPFFHYSDT